jgi:hypothetical protein
MKQPKWIESIEVTDDWKPGFWVIRGWDRAARVNATAVIDAVAVDMTIIDADHRRSVPIGGIARAGARGVSKVELQVDDGPHEAALGTPLSHLTWVSGVMSGLSTLANTPLPCVVTRENGTPQVCHAQSCRARRRYWALQ